MSRDGLDVDAGAGKRSCAGIGNILIDDKGQWSGATDDAAAMTSNDARVAACNLVGANHAPFQGACALCAGSAGT